MTDVTPPADTAAGSDMGSAATSSPSSSPTGVAGSPATPAAAAATSPDSSADAKRPNQRRIREGKVISAAMDKTAVVEITDRVRHPRYFKIVTRRGRLYVHDPLNDLGVGDTVRIQETRPISKTKRWRVLEIVERAR